MTADSSLATIQRTAGAVRLPDHALGFDETAVNLHTREDDGWVWSGSARYADPDLNGRLAALRRRVAGTEDALSVAVIIPDDQVLYTTVDAPEGMAGDEAVAAALPGLTPYAPDELSVDWRPPEGGQIALAAVWRQTLDEASAFARRHGFAPKAVLADPQGRHLSGGATFPYADTTPVPRQDDVADAASVDAEDASAMTAQPVPDGADVSADIVAATPSASDAASVDGDGIVPDAAGRSAPGIEARLHDQRARARARLRTHRGRPVPVDRATSPRRGDKAQPSVAPPQAAASANWRFRATVAASQLVARGRQLRAGPRCAAAKVAVRDAAQATAPAVTRPVRIPDAEGETAPLPRVPTPAPPTSAATAATFVPVARLEAAPPSRTPVPQSARPTSAPPTAAPASVARQAAQQVGAVRQRNAARAPRSRFWSDGLRPWLILLAVGLLAAMLLGGRARQTEPVPPVESVPAPVTATVPAPSPPVAVPPQADTPTPAPAAPVQTPVAPSASPAAAAPAPVQTSAAPDAAPAPPARGGTPLAPVQAQPGTADAPQAMPAAPIPEPAAAPLSWPATDAPRAATGQTGAATPAETGQSTEPGAAPPPEPAVAPTPDAAAIARALDEAVAAAPTPRPATLRPQRDRAPAPPAPPAPADAAPVVSGTQTGGSAVPPAPPAVSARPARRPAEAAPPAAAPAQAQTATPAAAPPPPPAAPAARTVPNVAPTSAPRPRSRPSAELNRRDPPSVRLALAGPAPVTAAELRLISAMTAAPARGAIRLAQRSEAALLAQGGQRFAQARPSRRDTAPVVTSDAVEAAVGAAVAEAAAPTARAGGGTVAGGRPQRRPGGGVRAAASASTVSADSVEGAIAAAIEASPAPPGGIALTALSTSPLPPARRSGTRAAPAEESGADDAAASASDSTNAPQSDPDAAQQAERRRLDDELQRQVEDRIRARAAADAQIDAQQRAAAEARARAQAAAEARAAASRRQPVIPVEVDNEPEVTTRVGAGQTSATVAGNATIKKGMDMSRTTLIGVVGAGPASRGLIRLRNGKIVTVRLGDRIDGGTITSIGNGGITYVKAGRARELRMLDGR